MDTKQFFTTSWEEEESERGKLLDAWKKSPNLKSGKKILRKTLKCEKTAKKWK